jgi:hypothetical protein
MQAGKVSLNGKIAIGIPCTLITLVAIVTFLSSETWQSTQKWIIQKYGDAMDRKLRKISGGSASDCGRVRIGQPPQTASQCVLDSFNAHKAFRVRYDILGVDTAMAGGLSQGKDGKIYAVSFMASPYGDGRITLLGQQVNAVLCPVPLALRLTPSGRVTCFPLSEPKRRNLSDPQMEPY